jgi:hypothetical protein
MKLERTVTAALVVTATLVANTVLLSTMTNMMQNAYGSLYINGFPRKAPVTSSGDNEYVVWSTHPSNNTGLSDEVIFRASNDGGKTFGEKINLSNSSKSDSQDAQIDASGDKVFVTWWERNQTSDIPVMRISTDNGRTFEPMLKLATNGTIGSSANEGG